MELYEYARPDLMTGKKILYLHGFASSGQNGTVKTMRLLLPKTEVIAPDIPVEPSEALPFLTDLAGKEKPDLVIGASMGGMYAELLRGIDRILVNPAFHLADTLLKNNGLGRQEFHSTRQDGQTSFLVTKNLLEDFRTVSSRCFEGMSADVLSPSEYGKMDAESGHVYGMFGTRDLMVDTYDEFASHYPNAMHFDGGHYMDDSVFLHSVLPLIERIDDRQEGRNKPVLIITLADTLMDMSNGEGHGLKTEEMEPYGSAVKAFSRLTHRYAPHVLISCNYNEPERIPALCRWVEKHIGAPAWNRVIISSHKDMILGDYLIDRHPERLSAEDFMGTVLHFGEEPFRTWEDVLTYFDRLGGQ